METRVTTSHYDHRIDFLHSDLLSCNFHHYILSHHKSHGKQQQLGVSTYVPRGGKLSSLTSFR